MMKYAKILLVLIILSGTILFLYSRERTDSTPPQEEVLTEEVQIDSRDIKENYYSGTVPTITGGGELGKAAQTYIESEVETFAEMANKEVPDRIAEFGAGTPPTMYTIEMTASIENGEKTRSIILDNYRYQGGANGFSYYKVFTATIETGKVVVLKDVLAPGMESQFLKTVQQELYSWTDKGVFKENIAALTIEDLGNWSFAEDGSMTIYFDKYTIGPGALGASKLILSKEKIGSFLK